MGNARADLMLEAQTLPSRISPEAPVPIVRRRHDKQVVRRAGNVGLQHRSAWGRLDPDHHYRRTTWCRHGAGP